MEIHTFFLVCQWWTFFFRFGCSSKQALMSWHDIKCRGKFYLHVCFTMLINWKPKSIFTIKIEIFHIFIKHTLQIMLNKWYLLYNCLWAQMNENDVKIHVIHYLDDKNISTLVINWSNIGVLALIFWEWKYVSIVNVVL